MKVSKNKTMKILDANPEGEVWQILITWDGLDQVRPMFNDVKWGYQTTSKFVIIP